MQIRKLIIIVCMWCIAHQAHSTPQRIVSLKPNITEILFALGAGEQIVGVTSWCDYPAAAQNITKVGDYIRPSIEGILALEPDIIFSTTENSARRPIEQLAHRGLRVELLQFDSLTHTQDSISALGKLLQRSAAAKRLTQQMNAATASPTAHNTPRTMIVTSWHPLIVAGPQSFIGELLTQAGAAHAINVQRPAYPNISAEHVLMHNPECIIDISHQHERGSVPTSYAAQLRHTTALRNNCVHQLDVALLRAGPRLVQGMAALREALHE